MSELRVACTGDVQINRDDPESAFEYVHPLLTDADIAVSQLECLISEKGTIRSDVQNPAHRVPPGMEAGLAYGGVDAVTFAGNNNVDYGPDAMFGTVDRLGEVGIDVVGVGEDIDDAREPLYLTADGATLAVVNTCSILRSGYAATETSPGLSPLRVTTYYETLENVYEQPGTPARTGTEMNMRDVRAVLDVIREANRRADFVLACFHWGAHFTFDLLPYQPELAYEAINAGADAVVGTHPHNLQAIDAHRGKPIFYSLGNFVFDQPDEFAESAVASGYLEYYGMSTESGARAYPHPKHTRYSALVNLLFGDDGVDFELTPIKIDADATPVPVDLESEDGQVIVGLLRALSEEIGVSLEADDAVVRLAGDAEESDARLAIHDRTLSYPWLHKLSMTEYGDLPLSIEDIV